jgi:putative transposase
MRHPRKIEEGARYHVTSRANRKEMIFDSKGMRELFISVVKKAKRKYSFRLENFTIMGNHIHFIIQPSRGNNLSVIMRWILSVFAMAYNKITGLTGHVWGDRFFSRIIPNLRELLQTFEYIDNNPVKASLVINRCEWRWGGLWHDRTGQRDLVEASSSWLRPFIPEHEQLLLK